MEEIILERIASLPFGMFGRIDFGEKTLYTVEREWKNNERMISCIPNGIYTCKRGFFNRGGYETIEICDVPDRSHILFHIANFPRELNGCIGLGESIGIITTVRGPELGVINSRVAFNYFCDKMLSLTPFKLIIRTSVYHFPPFNTFADGL